MPKSTSINGRRLTKERNTEIKMVILEEDSYSNEVVSESVQELIGEPPKSLMRWGAVIFSLIVLSMVVVCFFVRYAEVITGNATVNATNTPKAVISRLDGKLIKMPLHENQKVKKGQILAFMESTANHEEVIKLSKELNYMLDNIRKHNWNAFEEYNIIDFRNLGELQQSYQVFIQNFIQLKSYLSNGVYMQKKGLLNEELLNLSALRESLEEEKVVHEKDYEIASQDFTVKEELYKEKVIPLLEYKQENSKLLNKKLPIENSRSALIDNRNSSIGKRNELLNIEQQFNDQKASFSQSLNTLISEINNWSKQYLLISPIDGTIVFPSLIQEGQDVKVGQDIFYVLPQVTGYTASMLVSQENYGKVALGQSTLIWLQSYPYQIYGRLEGSVIFLSSIPNKDGYYYVSIKLNDSLMTDYGKRLNFKNGLTGTAEIITKKTRVINKILYTFRMLIDKPKSAAGPVNLSSDAH